MLWYHVGMDSNAKQKRQYTIRNVPRSVDRALRQRARDEGKSLNLILLEALSKEVGVGAEPELHHDLDALIGSWIHDPETEKALSEQRKINPRDWE